MTQAPATTTRWRPTPDQLMILEELYMGGIKTPSAAQIRRITGHLSLYGKVECKNVFYWFQNHKAREKQKIRKRMLLGKQLQMQVPHRHMQLQHRIMGEDNHPNGVFYFIEPRYNCGFVHSLQGRCGSPQMSDNTWLRLYCTDNNDDAPMMTSLTTHVGRTDSSPSSPPATMDAVTACVATTTTIRPLETLELFPTTASTAEHHPVVRNNIIATNAVDNADTSLVLQML
ncbi:hypothetical protein Droror1_Dr00013475 [Drosera rotundifolia]